MRKLLAILLIVATPVWAFAAIEFDAAGTGSETAGTDISWSHTIAEADELLVVGVANEVGASLTTGSCTYNGDAMTLVTGRNQSNLRVAFWYLVNPDTGANSVSCTFGSSFSKTGVSTSYTGVSDTQPDSSSTGGSDSASGLTVSTTVVAGNSWAVAMFGNSTTGAMTEGTDTTNRTTSTGDSFRITVADSNQAIAPGPRSLIESGSSGEWGAVIISIAPSAAGGGGAILAGSMSF